MKNKTTILGGLLVLFTIVFTILLTLTGCDDKTQEEDKNNTNTVAVSNEPDKKTEEKPKKDTIKNGMYKLVITEAEEGLADGDVYVEIEDNIIQVADSFAMLAQTGTYEVKGNKIIGTYTEIEYLDHSTGEITKKEINDKLEFELMEDGTVLKDIYGYGKSLDNIMLKGATYKLDEDAI